MPAVLGDIRHFVGGVVCVLQFIAIHILGGLQIEEGVLWCCTEKVTKADLDRTVAIVKEVCA